jgi:radical SAM superfamily enzyme YgiQ (UPF0313 family)
LLIANKTPIKWQCYTRADCVDEELAYLMKKSGCETVFIAIESASDRLLTNMKKGETLQEIELGINLLNNIGININVFIMMGFNGESKSDVLNTVEFAKKVKPSSIIANILTPYPGTELFDNVVKSGKLSYDQNWEDYYHQSGCMGVLSDLDRRELDELKVYFFNETEKYNRRYSFFRKLQRAIKYLVTNPFKLIFTVKSNISERLMGKFL